jgi:hypothetical protein
LLWSASTRFTGPFRTNEPDQDHSKLKRLPPYRSWCYCRGLDYSGSELTDSHSLQVQSNPVQVLSLVCSLLVATSQSQYARVHVTRIGTIHCSTSSFTAISRLMISPHGDSLFRLLLSPWAGSVSNRPSQSQYRSAQSGGRAVICSIGYWAVGSDTRRCQEYLYEMGAQPNRCGCSSHLAFSFGGPATDLLDYWMLGSASNVKYQQSSSR